MRFRFKSTRFRWHKMAIRAYVVSPLWPSDILFRLAGAATLFLVDPPGDAMSVREGAFPRVEPSSVPVFAAGNPETANR
jgi:hypothetical protein